jgi:hypothetical protein
MPMPQFMLFSEVTEILNYMYIHILGCEKKKIVSLKIDTVLNQNVQNRYQVTPIFDTCNGFVGNVQHTLIIVL